MSESRGGHASYCARCDRVVYCVPTTDRGPFVVVELHDDDFTPSTTRHVCGMPWMGSRRQGATRWPTVSTAVKVAPMERKAR